MKKNKCYYRNDCQNSDGRCYCHKDEKCVRFLPVKGTNMIKFDGYVEVQPEVDVDIFSQMFVNWVDSMGWLSFSSFAPYEEDE